MPWSERIWHVWNTALFDEFVPDERGKLQVLVEVQGEGTLLGPTAEERSNHAGRGEIAPDQATVKKQRCGSALRSSWSSLTSGIERCLAGEARFLLESEIQDTISLPLRFSEILLLCLLGEITS